MGTIRSYRELDVWKQARSLVKSVYQLSNNFPKTEQYGLVSQLRRAAISVPSNIAEGCGRNHYKDSIQFFFVARGSLYEIETQLILSSDLGFILEDELNKELEQVTQCKKLLNGFINYFQKQSNDNRPQTVNETVSEYLLRATNN